LKKNLKKILKDVDLYDYIKMFKDQFFKPEKEKELEKKRLTLYSEFVKKDDLCYDIGANYGNRTEIFLQLGANVVSVEPQPEQARFLERKFKKNIHLVKKAIGAEPGQSLMYISADNPLSSLSPEWIQQVKRERFKHVSWDNTIEVELTTIDKLIEKYGKPDFCKIDVEGYELEVIKGLSEPISYISFEFTIPEFTNRAVECINRLNNLGKIVLNYSPGETLEFELDKWLPADEFLNLFLTLPSRGIVDGDIYVNYPDI
jgi:FkbM family methyltransferase